MIQLLQLFTLQFFLIIELIHIIFINIHYILGTIFIILFCTNIYLLYNEITNIKYVNKKKPDKMRVNFLLD